MCKCTQTDGYVQAMQNAVSVEKKTGIEQAVFTKNGISYFGKREDVAKQEGICCYILTTGEEIQIEVEKKEDVQKGSVGNYPADFETKSEMIENAEKPKADSKTADGAIKGVMKGIDEEMDKMEKAKKDSKK